MKKIILTFHLILVLSYAYAQNINLGTETFNYNGSVVNHYGLGWYNDPSGVGAGPMAYLSAFGGTRFFTMGIVRATLDKGGFFGLNTESPEARLHIFNSYNAGVKSSLKVFYEGTWGTAEYASSFRFIDIASSEGGKILQLNGYGMGVGYDPPTYDSSDRLYVNGNVAIGTTDTKGYKLAVKGSVVASSVTVKTYGTWPDYVFDASYKLPSLNEIEKFILINKHLPGMPSAKTINDNGLDLGNMQNRLLKNQEELTLHLIEKSKAIERLEQENKMLREEQARMAITLQRILDGLKIEEAGK